MCSGRETSDADKNRAVPSVARQQESLLTLKDKADEPMVREPKMASAKNCWHAPTMLPAGNIVGALYHKL